MKNILLVTMVLSSLPAIIFGQHTSTIMASSNGYFEFQERQLEEQIRTEEINCTDKVWENCSFFARNRLCNVYRKTLRKRCRKSCNICGHESCAYSEHGCCWDMRTPALGPNGLGCPRNCHNRFGLHKCHFLKANGGCHKYGDLMQKMCNGVCNCDWNLKIPEKSCSFSKHGCCWDGTTTSDPFLSNCPVCRDHFSERFCRVFIHLCTEYDGKGGWQMRNHCQKTCGVCRFFKRKLLNSYLEDLKKEVEIINKIQNN